MRVLILKDSKSIGEWAAAYIVEKIKNFIPTTEKPYFVLGLPTGSSPLAMYKELVKLYNFNSVTKTNKS